jgi:hypothetical protein
MEIQTEIRAAVRKICKTLYASGALQAFIKEASQALQENFQIWPTAHVDPLLRYNCRPGPSGSPFRWRACKQAKHIGR